MELEPELLSLDRLPLPSLKVYTCLSVLAASLSVYYIGTESGSALRKLAQESQESCKFSGNSNIIPLNDNIISTTSDGEGDNGAVLLDTFSDNLGLLARYIVNDYWRSQGEDESSEGSLDNHASQPKNVTESDCLTDREGYQDITWQLFHWACQQPHCVWPLVNLVYCLIILGSHAVQKCVFGNLRSSEEENIKDQFWNLVFYKVVFVFGVVDVHEIEDAVGWCFFVSMIGYLQLARQLCQERHNYLIMINDTSKSSEARRHSILRLLSFIFATSISLFLAVIIWFMNSSPKEFSHDFLDLRSMMLPVSRRLEEEQQPVVIDEPSAGYDFNLGLHSAIFMLSEITLLILQTLHALTMCIFDHIHFRHKSWKWNPLPDSRGKGLPESEQEDLYLCASQNINYKFEIVSLLFDLIHHVHMFVCCNLFLSMTSLIVSLQMRLRVKQIHAVLKRRKSFTSLNEHIDRYLDVSHDGDEAAFGDNCAICWDELASQKSKVLPCNHMFHKTCLRKWLLVSMHCPTCRLSLLSEEEAKLRRENEPRRIYGPRPPYGIMGLLQTGQTLLDLFGGWDPLPDDYPEADQPIPNEAPALNPPRVQETVPTSANTSTEESPQEGTSRARKDD